MKHILIIISVLAGFHLFASHNSNIKNNTGTNNKIENPLDGDYFQVETIGRKGVLRFSSDIKNQPKSAKITLYGKTKSEITEFKIVKGTWANSVFTGHIMSGKNPEVPANLPGLLPGKYGLKIKFIEGVYRIVGVIAAINELQSSLVKSIQYKSLFLGYDQKANILELPEETEKFALVINDKNASAKDGEYSYGWYIDPYVTITKNYRTVHIVKDDLYQEFALYAFENSELRPEKGVEKYKIKAYKYKKITNLLSSFIKGIEEKDLKPDLVALLINEAQLRYPSKLLGMKSEGHGSSFGIMNGFLENKSSIKYALSLIKAFNSKPIDFLDFSTNCNVASFYNLIAVAPYVSYVVASDLTRNSPNPTIGKRPDDGPNYANYFKDTSQKIPDILGAMMDSYESLYNEQKTKLWYLTPNALKYGNTLSGWKQQLTLFDMNKFPSILNNIGGENAYETCTKGTSDLTKYYYPEESWKQLDFKTAIPLIFPNYTSFQKDWDSFVIKQISNRKGLNWDTDAPNGLILNTK